MVGVLGEGAEVPPGRPAPGHPAGQAETAADLDALLAWHADHACRRHTELEAEWRGLWAERLAAGDDGPGVECIDAMLELRRRWLVGNGEWAAWLAERLTKRAVERVQRLGGFSGR